MADGSEHARSCLRCQAQEACIPTEAQLKIFATEDWSPETLAFMPRPMNLEQAVAAEMLTAALARYWRAFGVEVTGSRLNSFLLVLRDLAKRMRITRRRLDARDDINARARAAWERGDTDAMRAIEAEPTPDYPQRAADEAWLRESLRA